MFCDTVGRNSWCARCAHEYGYEPIKDAWQNEQLPQGRRDTSKWPVQARAWMLYDVTDVFNGFPFDMFAFAAIAVGVAFLAPAQGRIFVLIVALFEVIGGVFGPRLLVRFLPAFSPRAAMYTDDSVTRQLIADLRSAVQALTVAGLIWSVLLIVADIVQRQDPHINTTVLYLLSIVAGFASLACVMLVAGRQANARRRRWSADPHRWLSSS